MKRVVSVSRDLVAVFEPCLSVVVAKARGSAVAVKVLLAAFVGVQSEQGSQSYSGCLTSRPFQDGRGTRH